VAEKTSNLIDDRDVTVALLANPLEWRVRVIEEIAVDAATTCLRRRSLQVAPLRQHIGTKVPSDITHALLALYVAPIPRGPLLDFDVSGPDGDGWLLPRLEIAEREALYLEGLAEACGHPIGFELHVVLSAVSGFTGELLTEIDEDFSLGEYLEAGLGRPVPDAVLTEWSAISDECRMALRPRLDVFHGYSAPENPALVLPELFAAGYVSTDEEATDCLTGYMDLIVAMNQRTQSSQLNAADEFLVALADYADYYDLMVAMRVPLDEPFMVKFSERRDLTLSPFSNRGQQDLVVADASTNHVTFKIPDPNVRIRDFRAIKPNSNHYSYGAFQSRQDPQNRAFYAHDPDRDYRIRLSFQLGLLRRLQLVPYFVAGLLGLLTVALWIQRPTELSALALIVGPAALAASVLLAREPSTLGSRLRMVSSLTLAAALLVLVASSVILYASGLRGDQKADSDPSQPAAPAHSDTPTEPSQSAGPAPSSPPPSSSPRTVPTKK